jgi:hypothetical protein
VAHHSQTGRHQPNDRNKIRIGPSARVLPRTCPVSRRGGQEIKLLATVDLHGRLDQIRPLSDCSPLLHLRLRHTQVPRQRPTQGWSRNVLPAFAKRRWRTDRCGASVMRHAEEERAHQEPTPGLRPAGDGDPSGRPRYLGQQVPAQYVVGLWIRSRAAAIFESTVILSRTGWRGPSSRVIAMIAGGCSLVDWPTDAWMRRMDRERRVALASRISWHYFKQFDWLNEHGAMQCPRLVHVGGDDRPQATRLRRLGEHLTERESLLWSSRGLTTWPARTLHVRQGHSRCGRLACSEVRRSR